MTGNPIASIDPGDVDTEVAGRAARRISDYLSSHPGEDLIEALGEVGTEDALVIPRPTVVMLAQVLSLLESGHGVQIIPLMQYKRQDDLQRRAAADDLADLSQELGLY